MYHTNLNLLLQKAWKLLGRTNSELWTTIVREVLLATDFLKDNAYETYERFLLPK